MEPSTLEMASDSLKRAMDMLETIDELENKSQYYLHELELSVGRNQELQSEINELNDAIDSLSNENEQLAKDARQARKAFTVLQISVSLLVFVYGIMYGAYFGKCL